MLNGRNVCEDVAMAFYDVMPPGIYFKKIKKASRTQGSRRRGTDPNEKDLILLCQFFSNFFL